MKAHIGQATDINAKLTEREIKKRIGKPSQPGWGPLAGLTKDIKRSTGMLFDKGELFKSITKKLVNYKTVFVGVLMTAKKKDGGKLANIALVLHEGATIKVTQKMRRLFWALWAARIGILDPANLVGRARELWDRTRGRTKFYKLSDNTTAIRIPGRPFFRDVFEDKAFLMTLKKNWEEGVSAALKARP